MKNIVENNKLIAEFMGEFDKILSTGNIHSWSDAPFYYTTEDTKEKVIKNISKYSKYSKDWNWLMSVVEKIESIEYGVYQVDILQEGCKILKKCSLLIDKTVSKLEPDTTKIKSVYLACVEFIKWYNEQNKK